MSGNGNGNLNGHGGGGHHPPAIYLESVPVELRAARRWVVWRWVERDGKRTKPPFDPATDRPGDATDGGLWMPLDRALAEARRFDGIGFAVSADCPYAGIDLDGCLDADGNLAPWAEAIVRRLDSYTEITPSGRGVRIWVRGKLPPGRRRKGPVEMYDSGRYFTVTGHRLPGTPDAIRDRAVELAELHGEIFAAAPRPDPEAERRAPRPATLSDQAILARMFLARNGHRAEALFRGDTADYASGSEADLALCAHLAFWTGGDADAIDRLFRLSALCDAKWTTRADYRERTIGKALEGANFYEPPPAPPVVGPRPAAAGPVPDAPPGADPEPMPGDAPLNGTGAEAPDDPHRLARLFLERHARHPDGLTLRYWSEEWHRWDGLAWRVCADREIAAEVTGAIKFEHDRTAALTGERPRPVTTKGVANVVQALRHLALLPTWIVPRQPAWLATEPGEDWPDPREILPAANTLVHLPSLVDGPARNFAPTPRFFSPTTLGYAFRDDAGEPAAWLDFLRGLWPDDPESIACLQEWFGYLLTPDTYHQKMLVLIGPKRSGKGTIGRVLRALVGAGNVAAPTLSGLATNFGLAPLIGKTVALIADARLSGRADQAVIVERLLSITGEDAQTIDRKHLSGWTGNLAVRFVLISNELPRLGDASGALPSRMILLRLTRSFYGHEDTTLTGRLLAERPAILRWAIAGWARLRARGHFIQPASGAELLDDLDELSSPVAAFVAERCEVGPDWSVAVKDLFGAWKLWCDEKGRALPGDEQGFGRNLRAVLPELKLHRPRSDGLRQREYQGIGLRAAF